MPRRIESHFIPGPAGRLEALLEEPEHGEPREAALVCHPHPQHGGTMHNKVVYRIARALRHSGAVVLRFNYRGVNLSEGSYDRGRGERDDARAALDWLRERYPSMACSIAGFSFGSRIALALGCADPAVSRVLAVGFPTGFSGFEFLAQCATPKIFVQSTRDQFGPQAELERLYAGFAEPKRIAFVPAGDHFFKGALDEFEALLAALLAPPAPPDSG